MAVRNVELHPCPEEGSGVHSWMFSSACYLRRRGWEDEEIFRRIEEGSPRKDAREISDAVRNSAAAVQAQSSFRRSGGRVRPPGRIPKAEPNRRAISRLFCSYGGEITLRAISPVDPEIWTPENVLDLLFPDSPLLCVGTTDASARTVPRDEIRGREENFAKIVPNPMSKEFGVNKRGQKSRRCLDNTGPRRFLVCEFDHEGRETQAGALIRLAEIAPMTLALWSGRRSLHGWFFCEGVEERLLAAFFRFATSLGADPALYTRCQLVRMPGGTRVETGNRQKILFLNPHTIPGGVSIPPPADLCPQCWFENSTAQLRGSSFPCRHQEGK